MENKEIKNETIMKKVKEVCKIAAVPIAIIIGALLIKNQMQKPSIKYCVSAYDSDYWD
ncbi:hypothetical protein [Prevotella sp. E13-27]|jgi:hypothetical protein|uniref:hypothetical protein n=1 Tax=Prevotella sp. E13-27 TaxID=2938122 RepID=UPI00200A32F6|nr:hypothetical protein [Prevotella sp. E13-27]MCK8621450.1 hypothetical protein [Prevotella sp. E13-27]MCK8622482.1 hypothetical protein [Prevotella sp. E13-27]